MDYHEHEKLEKIKDQSQVIGEFLDYCGYTLCKWQEEGDNGQPRYLWRPEYASVRTEPPVSEDYWRGRAEENPEFEDWSSAYVPVGKSITHSARGVLRHRPT